MAAILVLLMVRNKKFEGRVVNSSIMFMPSLIKAVG
jgi:hypothetical protein